MELKIKNISQIIICSNSILYRKGSEKINMNKVMNYFRNKAAFTLIELIVVAAILAIIAGVAIPTFIGFSGQGQEKVYL